MLDCQELGTLIVWPEGCGFCGYGCLAGTLSSGEVLDLLGQYTCRGRIGFELETMSRLGRTADLLRIWKLGTIFWWHQE